MEFAAVENVRDLWRRTKERSAGSVVVGVDGRASVGQEMRGFQWRCDELEGLPRLREIKTIGEVVCGSVREAERGQLEIGLDELEQAAEIVGDVRNVGALGERGDDNQRDSKTVFVGVLDLGRNVIVPAAPVVPGEDRKSVV